MNYFDDLSRVENAIIDLREGHISNLSVLYVALFSDNKTTINLAATEISSYMQGLDSKQIIRLSDSFRMYGFWYGNINWKNVSLLKLRHNISKHNDYLWVLRLGTFHPNGYFRQMCLERLMYEDKTSQSISFMALRLNDWVMAVRNVAIEACERVTGMGLEEMIGLLPYLDKLNGGLRKNEDEYNAFSNTVINNISNRFDEIDLSRLFKYDEKTRKSLYKIMLELHLVSKEQLFLFLQQERSSHCQCVLLDLYFKHYQLVIDDLDLLLTYKSKIIQRKVLEKKYDFVGTYWKGVEGFLLADASGVREIARFIVKKHTNIEPLTYYLDRIESQYKKICIIGIGECGTKKDVDVLMPYIHDEDTVIGKAALCSVSKLLGDEAVDLLYTCLCDVRPSIMRCACREIAKNNILLGAKQVYGIIEQTDSEYLKNKMIYRLLSENSWDRLPYLLMFYWHEDKYIRKAIRDAVDKRSLYVKVSKAEADRIRNIMYDEKYNIPQGVCEKIEFELKYISS